MTDNQKRALTERMERNLPMFRKKLDLSQAELADLIGIGAGDIARIEIGDRGLSWTEFISLISVFYANKACAELMISTGTLTEELQLFLRADRNPDEMTDARAAHQNRIIANLAEDFDCIFYVETGAEEKEDVTVRYRISSGFLRAVPGLESVRTFRETLRLLIENYVYFPDRDMFLRMTQRDVILDQFRQGTVYYVNFRGVGGGTVTDCQIKFSADRSKDGTLKGFVAGIHATDEENSRLRAEKRDRDVINVLSYEYNAVYYCDADTHSYEILFQQGFVKEELDRMQQMFPHYEDAFRFFVKTMVHPDDQGIMNEELQRVTEKLQTSKSFKREFQRRYGSEYRYTEMNCVKTEKADEQLHYFVVGFLENDAEFRELLDRQKQMEYMINERTAELRTKNTTLNRINEEIIELLGNITEARNLESGEHIRRVKGYTKILATQMMTDWPEYGITGDSVELMTSASALHDIGKIMIPDSILLKPGKLTPEEFEIMKTHCERGCDMLRKAPADWNASYLTISYDICRYHHEKYDGRGYPLGLKGDAIPVAAQIVSVADCFDALTSKRVYKDAYDLDTAFSMIQKGECGAFSEKLMQSFRNCRSKMFRHAMETDSRVVSAMPAGLSTASLSWTKIMLVDDNELGRDLGAELLESEGAAVVTAGSGTEAVELFRSSSQSEFDAILMDVIMPEMDGVEATAQIRAMDRHDAKTIPIIALTSLAKEEEMYHCLEAGMSSFLTKPISISALNKILYECLQNSTEALNSAIESAEQTANERLRRIVAGNQAFSGHMEDYDLVCYISGGTNDVPAIVCAPHFQKIMDGISLRLPSNRRLDQFFKAIVPPKLFQNFRDDTNRSRIVNFLQDHPSYHLYAPALVDGEEIQYRMIFVQDTEAPGNYVLTMQNMDAEAQEELRAREMIQILTDSYLVVDYIDLQEDRFTRFQSAGKVLPEFGNSGIYSQISTAYVDRCVYEADRDMMHSFMNRGNIRGRLWTHKSTQLRFRDIRSGEPRYCEIQCTNAREKEGARYAILTIADIDELVRKEISDSRQLEETQKHLLEAEIRARRDELTGVKNVASYTEAVANLSARLRNSPGMEFAVALCDINDLKKVNDSFGHDVGDIFIKNCCRIICDVFSNSPVYRIGGDEFVVILSGMDFNNRDALMEKLQQVLGEAERIPTVEAGRASFSIGIAEYESGRDSGVSEVVKRADTAMYINKRSYKSRNGGERE